jgi:hypothetical protein
MDSNCSNERIPSRLQAHFILESGPCLHTHFLDKAGQGWTRLGLVAAGLSLYTCALFKPGLTAPAARQLAAVPPIDQSLRFYDTPDYGPIS